MARNPSCTVYVGNLDEKVTDRILYELLIQVGCVVDLYMPLDKETQRHKSYAFAEYESEEIANYAVRLFSGLVRLHNKTLKFAMRLHPYVLSTVQAFEGLNIGCLDVCWSHLFFVFCTTFPNDLTNIIHFSMKPFHFEQMSGQDKPSQNTGTPVTPKTNSTPLSIPRSVHGREAERFQGLAQSTDCRVSAYTRPVTPVTPVPNSPHLPRPYPPHVREMVMFPDSPQSINCRVPAYTNSLSPGYPQAPAHGFVNNGFSSSNFDYSRQVFGSMLTDVSHSVSQHPVTYPSYSQYH